ncbi:AaceriADL278Cp [[Ashbya] aceris (nom. inval.)]|nr:AaceriADL278Cp [[Ashbya] aceris (nom. inval.)]
MLRRSVSLVLGRRNIACKSCGIELQNKIKDGPGYFVLPQKTVRPGAKQLELAKQLLYGESLRIEKQLTGPDKESLQKWKELVPPSCKRCMDALHHNRYDTAEFPEHTLEDVGKSIPRNAVVYHIAPLWQFPMGLDRRVLQSSKKVCVLFSKIDMVVQRPSFMPQEIGAFFQSLLSNDLHVKITNFRFFSALKQWNIQTVRNALSKESYLLGGPNAGKSSLINALMRTVVYEGRRLVSLKQSARDPADLPIKAHLDMHSAGVSTIPNFTRRPQQYEIKDKIIHDVPGYRTSQTHSFDFNSMIKKDYLLRLRKSDSKTFLTKNYTSINGTESGRCYTVGGLFYYVPPAQSINQVTRYMPGDPQQFQSVDKGLEVVRDVYSDRWNKEATSHPLAEYIHVNPALCDKSLFVRHIIPPFQGAIEIVLRDVGYMRVVATGSFKFLGLHEIWVPKGIEVSVREPLTDVFKTAIETYRNGGSAASVARLVKKRPYISSTYPMAHDEADPLGRMREMYLERTASNLSSRRLMDKDPLALISEKQKERVNLYWHYCW